MRRLRNQMMLACLAATLLVALASPRPIAAQANPAPSSADASIAKAVGTIKSVQHDSITITAAGGDVTANLTGSTKILRVLPGAKNLENAAVLQPQDLQPGDGVRVRGRTSADGHAINALEVLVLKQSDVSAQHQREREDWQKRGVDGLVNKVEASTGTITISSGGLGAKKSIAVHASKNTVLRRYAPDSVKFDDAKPAPLDQIKVGDQLRARGTRAPDGSELTAEEVVSGTFPFVEGTITAIDAANHTVTVHDVISKAPVVVKISSDSQMKKLPLEMAQRFAARLKGGAGASGNQPADSQNKSAQMTDAPQPGAAQRTPDSQPPRGPGGGSGANGSPDLQRLLSRLPSSTLADLQKGDAVAILSTQSGDPGTVTAIQLLAGVEPILTAAPSRTASSLLSPWSLNTSGGEGESAP